MQKSPAEGLIWLIGAASVKWAAGPQGAGQWVGSKQATRLAGEALGKAVDSRQPH